MPFSQTRLKDVGKVHANAAEACASDGMEWSLRQAEVDFVFPIV